MTNEDKGILINLLQEKIDLLSKELRITTDKDVFNTTYKRFAKLVGIQTQIEMDLERPVSE